MRLYPGNRGIETIKQKQNEKHEHNGIRNLPLLQREWDCVGVMAMKGPNFYTYQWPEDSGEWRLIIRKGDDAVELLPDELDRLISVIVNFKKRQEEKAQKNG